MTSGEVLSVATQEQLREFLELHKTGQFILHIKEGKIQKVQETSFRPETLDKEQEEALQSK